MSDYQIIDELYTNATYSKRYGGDIFLTIIIVIIALLIIGYFVILNNLQSLRSNWNKERCNPLNFPFIPIINPDPNKNAMQQITDTINQCMKEGINDMISGSLDDIYNKFDQFNSLKENFDKFVLYIQNFFLWLVNTIIYLINLLISILRKGYLGFVHMYLKAQDIMNKLGGILATNFFIFVLIINTSIAFIINWATILTIILITPTGSAVAGLTGSIIGLSIFATLWGAVPFGAGLPVSIPTWAAVAILVVVLLLGVALLVILSLLMTYLIKIQNRAKKYLSIK